MKFVHAADLHLDSPLVNLMRRDPRQVERMQRATREAFTRLVDLCIEQEAALLVIAGDLYDHDSPNMQIAVFLRRELRRLESSGIRCVIIKGNHDAANKITSALALPVNTRVLGDHKPETVTFDDLPVRVAVHGQSFQPGRVPDNLAACYPAPLPGYYNIGLLHTSLAAPGGEHDPYAPCTLEQLTSRGYDYWALGHIHRREVLCRDPFVVFPGNLQGRHAREAGPKGCYLIEVDDSSRTVSAEFIALDVVRWLRAEVDLKGCDSEAGVVERLRHALLRVRQDSDSRAAAVRVELTGCTPLYAQIARRPHRWRETALGLADDIAGDDIWIEKIVNDTTAPGDGIAVGFTGDARDLVGIMQEIAGDAAQMGPLLVRDLEPLRTKLPEDLKELESLKLIDTPALCRQMLDRLEPRLAARLSGEEDA